MFKKSRQPPTGSFIGERCSVTTKHVWHLVRRVDPQYSIYIEHTWSQRLHLCSRLTRQSQEQLCVSMSHSVTLEATTEASSMIHGNESRGTDYMPSPATLNEVYTLPSVKGTLGSVLGGINFPVNSETSTPLVTVQVNQRRSSGSSLVKRTHKS